MRKQLFRLFYGSASLDATVKELFSKKIINGIFYGSQCTGWLEIKCLTGQNAISRQPMGIFLSEFQNLKGKDFPTKENCQI